MSRFEFLPLAEAAPGHALAAVDGAEVPGGRLQVWLGPKIIGGRYFRADLTSADGSSGRFLQGLHNAGLYPGQNWAEIFDIDLPPGLRPDAGWELELQPYLSPLAAVVPPGGHLMVEYEKELWRSTQVGLLAGIPPIATPMGELLFRLGTGDSFKDWYFPEGGQEGGRKLQGNRGFTAEQTATMRARRAAELRDFLARPPRGNPATDGAARQSAERLLASIEPGTGGRPRGSS